MEVFDRYAPFIKDFIYQNRWENLRAVQLAAGDAIFNTDDNVLLCASTASGKTEAAFFPILTELYENPPVSVGALYIAPLKALINDQFYRLDDLCREADIPVWHWHGDVSQSHKTKLLKNPSGILQITPESLEALLMHKHMYIPKLFCDLRYVVIDEIHSLMRAQRGGQTMCLIERLSRLSGSSPRRIGLSATIGDPEKAGEFLAMGSGRNTFIPKIAAAPVKWRLSMEHFYVAPENNPTKTDSENTALQCLDTPSDIAPEGADPGFKYIFEHTKNKKCLVFVNSREECEAVTTTLRRYCEKNNEPDRFLIHHGNLSASFRETAEDAMKDDSRTDTTVTTATLELGIDIGRLERAFQVDAPFTVSSFLQRMGRTGRRGLPPEMWFVIREDEPEMRAMLPDTVPWKLLQGIALVQLYREEKWVEPPSDSGYPYSLLYHQTMATLASSGEMTARELAKKVLTLGYFKNISIDDFGILLKHLIKIEHIEKTDEGGLIVGIKGERIINSFKFYAVFQENEEFTVRNDSHELGTVVMPPPAGEKLAIAGKVWTVLDIDRKRHLVYVEPVKGQVPAYFGQCPGAVDTRVLERMKQALSEDTVYPYLMENAVARLKKARDVASRAGITEHSLINLGGDMWCLFPWLGSYAFLALERFIKTACAERLGIRGLSPCRPYYIQFKMKADADEFFRVLKDEARRFSDPMTLVYKNEVPLFEKYDEFVPEELVRKGFAFGVLDTDTMLERVQAINN
jgi:ATP-dependent helicase Lhr and Lhr-like helicase